MAGDPQQKNKPELFCGVAPKIAGGSVTDGVGQPPPGALPEREQPPHRLGLQLALIWELRRQGGKATALGGFSHTDQGPGEGNVPPGERVIKEPASGRTAAALLPRAPISRPMER